MDTATSSSCTRASAKRVCHIHRLLMMHLFFSCRRRHTSCGRDWSSDVCSSDLLKWNLQLTPGDRASVEAAISRVRLESLVDRKIHTLSDGQMQMVMIARALAQDTPIILLDRSEERRVGKECRSRRAEYQKKKRE